jgi:hypothetical protein
MFLKNQDLNHLKIVLRRGLEENVKYLRTIN